MAPARLEHLEQAWMAICELVGSQVVSPETRMAAARLKRMLELEMAAFHLLNDGSVRRTPPDKAA